MQCVCNVVKLLHYDKYCVAVIWCMF